MISTSSVETVLTTPDLSRPKACAKYSRVLTRSRKELRITFTQGNTNYAFVQSDSDTDHENSGQIIPGGSGSFCKTVQPKGHVRVTSRRRTIRQGRLEPVAIAMEQKAEQCGVSVPRLYGAAAIPDANNEIPPRIHRYYEQFTCNLEELLKDPRYKDGVPLQMWYRTALALLQNLYLMHKGEIVHRDLKPANILVTIDSNNNMTRLAYADFEFAQSKKDTKSEQIHRGTPDYLHPEYAQCILSKKVSDSSKSFFSFFDKTPRSKDAILWEILCKHDLWSISIVLRQLLCGLNSLKPLPRNRSLMLEQLARMQTVSERMQTVSERMQTPVDDTSQFSKIIKFLDTISDTRNAYSAEKAWELYQKFLRDIPVSG